MTTVIMACVISSDTRNSSYASLCLVEVIGLVVGCAKVRFSSDMTVYIWITAFEQIVCFQGYFQKGL